MGVSSRWIVVLYMTILVLIGRKSCAEEWPYKQVQKLTTIAELRSSELEKSTKLWIALYGAQDESILPIMEQVGQEMSYAVTFTWFSQDVAHSFGLQAAKTPILILFRDEPKWNPYQERMYRTVEMAHQFPSQLDLRGLKRLVREKIPSHVLTTLPEDTESWTADPSPRVILLTKKSTPSLLYKALSIEFPSLKFYSLTDSPELRSRFSIDEVPALFVATSATSLTKFTTSDGDATKIEDIRRFLAPHVSTDESTATKIIPSLWLSQEEFDASPKENDAWLIVFQSREDPQVVDPESDEWKQCLQELRSKAGLLVRIAMVDSTSKSGIFTIKYGSATSLEKHQGSLSSIPSKVVASIPDTTSSLYGGSDIQSFFGRMIQSTTPKISFLLFTNKKETPLVVQAIALTFPEHVNVGVVFHPDEATKKQFGIGKVPTMVAVMLPLDPSIPRDQFSMTFFDKKIMGPPNFENLHRFVAHVVQAYVPSKPAADAATPEVKVHSVATQDAFEKACTSLCVVGLFNGENDITSQETFQAVASLSAKAKHPLQYLYVDAICQRDFAAALGAETWHVPTVAVYSPSKRRYVRHVGVFDVDSTQAFVQSILAGKTTTIPMSEAPALKVECTAPVDSSDSDQVVAEEDLDDMEDMLREIREEEQRQKDALKRQLQEEAASRKAQEKAAEEAAAAAAQKNTKKKTKKRAKKRIPKDEL